MSEDLKQTREVLQKLCEDKAYSSNLISERVIHQIREIERYLTHSVYGLHCSNYDHSLEGTLKLRDIAFKAAKLIKSEMNFPEIESEFEVENFRKEIEEEKKEENQC